MAESDGDQMNLGFVDEPDMEMRDVHFWMDHLRNSIQQNQRTNEEIRRALIEIESSVTEQDRMNESIDTQSDILSEGFSSEIDSELLSPTAFKLTETTDGPLSAEDFREFLIHKSLGKPNFQVLPILRSFSHDVNGVKEQLQVYRSSLRQAHRKYKIERKKDENLERRIDRLIANISKAQEEKQRDGLTQTSIERFARSN